MKNFTQIKSYIIIVLTATLLSCGGNDPEEEINTIPISIETLQVTDISTSSAIIHARLNSTGKDVLFKGICINTTANASTNDSKLEDSGTEIGNYNYKFNDLKTNTKYFARAYVISTSGTIYGKEISFVTSTNILPKITTSQVTSITQNSAFTGGALSNADNSQITAVGVCYSTLNEIPTINDNKTVEKINNSNFTSQLSGLNSNTKYFIRAYALSNGEVLYGNVITFNTLKGSFPTVLTSTPSSINPTHAISGGAFSTDSGAAITSVGVCVSSINSTPTINESQTALQKDINLVDGIFGIRLTNLSPNTQYFTRSFIITNLGTFYGEVISFITKQSGIPVVTTNYNITFASPNSNIYGADANGRLISDGGSDIKEVGLCWSYKNPIPTVENISGNNKTVSGAPMTDYISGRMLNLIPNTVYYLRAYATNESGTGYGNIVEFTIPFR